MPTTTAAITRRKAIRPRDTTRVTRAIPRIRTVVPATTAIRATATAAALTSAWSIPVAVATRVVPAGTTVEAMAGVRMDTTAAAATVVMAAVRGITTRATVTDLRVSRRTPKGPAVRNRAFSFSAEKSIRPTFGTGNAMRVLLA